MKQDNKKFKIKVSKNGPYIISGKIPLKKERIASDESRHLFIWKKGEEFPEKKDYHLCRCGHSQNKPYCDLTHLRIDFDGTEKANRKPYGEKAEKIEGPEATLLDVPELCASAKFCTRAEGVWELTRKSADPKDKELAVKESCDCPSGRLAIIDKKTGKIIEPGFEPSISVVQDENAGVSGPLWVKGGIPVESSEGEVYEIRNRMTLCHCGQSRNMPFCDGTHITINFQDDKL